MRLISGLPVERAGSCAGIAVIDQPGTLIEGNGHLGFCTPSLYIDEVAFQLLGTTAIEICKRAEAQRSHRSLSEVARTNVLINLTIAEVRRLFVHTAYERYQRIARRFVAHSGSWTLSEALATRTGDCRLHAIVLAILLGPAGLAIPYSRFVYIECRDAPIARRKADVQLWNPVEDHGIVVFECEGRRFIADAYSRYYDRMCYDLLVHGAAVSNSADHRLGASFRASAGRPSWPRLSMLGEHGPRRFRYLVDRPRYLQMTQTHEGVFPLVLKGR